MSLSPTVSEHVQRLILRGVLALPRAARDRMFGSAPQNDRGQTLDDLTWVMCRLDGALGPGIGKEDPTRARAGMRSACATIAMRHDPRVQARDVTLAGRPARVYLPPDAAGLPAMLYLHGGGWVVGDLDTHDAFCRRLAADGRRILVALDYRLAPEHPFPSGLDDAVAAWRALPDLAASLGAHPDHLEVGGDSAGGNLSAALALRCLELDLPAPARMLLIYPAADLRRLTASYRALNEGYILDRETMDLYIRHYGVPDVADPLASVLLHPRVADLPPAIVATAGFDPLRDEGEQLAARLAERGRLLTHLHEPDLIHGYAMMDQVLPAADRAVRRLCEAVASSS